MKALAKNSGSQSRKQMANPHIGKSLTKRLAKKKTIDLINNHEFEDLGCDYSKIRPIDKNKLLK